MLKMGFRILLGLAVLAGFAYTIDALVLRLARNPYATVSVRSFYAVPQKNGRTEYLYNDAMDQQCVCSLFPHRGESPCWYLRRHPEQEIKIDTGSKPEYPH